MARISSRVRVLPGAYGAVAGKLLSASPRASARAGCRSLPCRAFQGCLAQVRGAIRRKVRALRELATRFSERLQLEAKLGHERQDRLDLRPLPARQFKGTGWRRGCTATRPWLPPPSAFHKRMRSWAACWSIKNIPSGLQRLCKLCLSARSPLGRQIAWGRWGQRLDVRSEGRPNAGPEVGLERLRRGAIGSIPGVLAMSR